MRLAHENLPSTWNWHAMRLGHYPCAQGMVFSILTCAQHVRHAPRASENVGHNRLFLLLFWVKPALLSKTHIEALTINTGLPYSEFLVQNCCSSRGKKLWSFRRVSIFALIFQGMFLSLVICFQLPCVTEYFFGQSFKMNLYLFLLDIY